MPGHEPDPLAEFGSYLETVLAAVDCSPCSSDPECSLDVRHHGPYAWIRHEDPTHGLAARLIAGETLISRPRAELVQRLAHWLRLLHASEHRALELTAGGTLDGA